MCDSGFFFKHLFLRIHPDTGHIQTCEGTTHWSLKMYLDKEPEGLAFEQALLWAVWMTPDHPLTTGKMITNVSWSNFPLKELHHTELFTQASQGQRLGFFYVPHSDWYMFSIHGRHFVLWPTVVSNTNFCLTYFCTHIHGAWRHISLHALLQSGILHLETTDIWDQKIICPGRLSCAW